MRFLGRPSRKPRELDKKLAGIAESYEKIMAEYGGFFPHARFPADVSKISKKELTDSLEELKGCIRAYEELPEDIRKKFKYDSEIQGSARELARAINEK